MYQSLNIDLIINFKNNWNIAQRNELHAFEIWKYNLI